MSCQDVRRLAGLLGGHLTLASEPGPGSTFALVPITQQALLETLARYLPSRETAPAIR